MHPQWLVGELLDGVCHTVTRVCIPLMHSESSSCHSVRFFPPSSHAAHDSVIWVEWEKYASFAVPHTAGEAECSFTCSPFLLWEKWRAEKTFLIPELCLLGRGCGVGKVKLFLLPSPLYPNIFFAPVVCWYISTGKLISTKAFSSMGGCLRWCFSETPRLQPWRAGTGSQTLAGFIGTTMVFLGSFVYGARSHSSHKDSFVCGWMPSFCWGGGEWWGLSYSWGCVLFSHVADFSLFLFLCLAILLFSCCTEVQMCTERCM